MNTEPSISVVMPVYNAAPYLGEAIESILAQTLREFEFVIVNDGSTDGSGEILRSFALQDTRIRLIEQANSGIVGALNRGLVESRGEFIARMDADDKAMPDRFLRQAVFLAEHPSVVAVGSAIRIVDSSGTSIADRMPPMAHADIERELLLGDGLAQCHPTMMIRRTAVETVGFYSKDYEWVEDVALFLSLARIGQLANIPEVLLCYRRHSASVNANKLNLQKWALYRLRQHAYEVRGLRLPRGFHWRPPEKEPGVWHLEQGWQAFKDRRRFAALFHAGAGIAWTPASPALWKLGICALIKTPRRRLGNSRGLV